MTRKEIAKEIYHLKKNWMPNVIGMDRPLTEEEFIKRYLYGCGGSKGFSKNELILILESEREKLDKRNGFASA